MFSLLKTDNIRYILKKHKKNYLISVFYMVVLLDPSCSLDIILMTAISINGVHILFIYIIRSLELYNYRKKAVSVLQLTH